MMAADGPSIVANTGPAGAANADLVRALRSDLDDLAKVEGRYMSERLSSLVTPAATADQIGFWAKHPNLGKTLEGASLDIIRRAADEFGNEAAKAFLAHHEAGNVDIVLSPEVGALGYYKRAAKAGDGAGNTIYVSPYFRDEVLTGGKSLARTLDDVASTMLHEFVHRMGHGELRAWTDQYRFLDQVGRKGGVKFDGARAHAARVDAEGEISAARALSDELRANYAGRYDTAKLDLHTRIDGATFEPIPLPHEVDRLRGLDLPSLRGK